MSSNAHYCKCGKKYVARKSLSFHQRVECGKDPQHVCKICGFKTYQKGNLKSHLIRRHPKYCQAIVKPLN